MKGVWSILRSHEKDLARASRRYFAIAQRIEPFFEKMKLDLLQAKSTLTLTEHLAMSIRAAVNSAASLSMTLVAAGIILDMPAIWKIGLASVPAIFLMMLYTALYRPSIAAKRRARLVEQELPYALRHLLIEIKSGVPLYNAIVAASDGYGECSEEFKQIVMEINAGKAQIQAIEDSIFRNPSLAYRRGFWQLLNAMKTGTNIETSLDNTVQNMLKDQLLSIKKYGQELNPWTLMYMMFAVILPSLGITFLMILSTFTGTGISGAVLAVAAAGLAIFQLFFMNVIKTKRPMVKMS